MRLHKMRYHTSLLWSVLLLSFSHGNAQLTADQLREAVQKQECKEIAALLDSTPLTSELMQFQAGVCYYRNGNTQRAFELFQEVHRSQGQFWPMAAFWEAKIYAIRGMDNKVIATLQSIPATALNYQMLSQPEFDDIAHRNKAFTRFKETFKPGFNVWTSLLAIIAGIGFLTSILLFFGKSRFSAGARWLSAVVLAFALILTAYLTIWTGYAQTFPYLRSMWPFLTLIVGPSLLFYLKAAFKEDCKRKEILLHYCLPAIAFLLTLPAMLSDFGLVLPVSPDLTKIGASPTLLTGQLLFYAVRITTITQNEWQVDANIKTWTKAVSSGMWLYTLAFLSYFILVACSFFNPQWDYAVSLVMALGILGITYMGLIQKRVFRSEPIGAFLPVQKYQTSNLTPAASASIRQKLERLLQEDQVFKENELRLDDLAEYLDINRHQMSQVINEHFGVNFFELINGYRIDYVKRALADPTYDQHTIIQIAYEAGFNNKASFNRYFKQATGLTPSAFRMKENSRIA